MRLDLREERRPPASVQTKTKVEHQLIESDSESEDDIDLEDDGRIILTPILLSLEQINSHLFPISLQSQKPQQTRNFI